MESQSQNPEFRNNPEDFSDTHVVINAGVQRGFNNMNDRSHLRKLRNQ